MAENFYSKENVTNLNDFSNFLFKEIEVKTNKTLLKNNLKSIKETRRMKNDMYGDFRLNVGDYFSTNRSLKLYVTKNQECSIIFNDTVHYQKMSNFNLIEHMILHNNAETVEPKGVYSEDMNVNFFAFNKKLNIFNVYFDNHNNKDNFSMEYDYDAFNLIKTNSDKNYTGGNLFLGHKYNSFVWKVLNQNLMKNKEKLTIDIYFQLGKDFELFDVDFNLNFTKSVENITASDHHKEHHNETIVKYKWEGTLQPQEVLIVEAKFPLYFEHCGEMSLNYYLIIMGATFIIFLIGMLHLILSSVCFQEY
jgi:hypothetical protein